MSEDVAWQNWAHPFRESREYSRARQSPENMPIYPDGGISMSSLLDKMLDGSRNKQVGGDHYKRLPIQPWDIIDALGLNFYEGNVLKYLLRRKGNRVEDLRKAQHYLEHLIELEKDNNL